MKILILAANPQLDLRLDREIRELKDVIERSLNRDQFEVIPELAVRVGDLQRLMLKHRPQVVHFCGHGSREQELFLEGENSGSQGVSTQALSELFRLFERDVECVLLNACYSEPQADEIANHINYVIGMKNTIRDDAAIAFSKGFYRALGYACSIEEAYELGCNSIQLEISTASSLRTGESVSNRDFVTNAINTTDIPEHLKPMLKKNVHLGANSGYKKAEEDLSCSQEKYFDIQLEIAKSLEEDFKFQQYRTQVRAYLRDRNNLTNHEKIVLLETLRRELGLSSEDTKRILDEEQRPIVGARKAYQYRLTKLIEEGLYPFSGGILRELGQFRFRLGLSHDEVSKISQPILAMADEEHIRKLEGEALDNQERTEQKKHCYEQRFRQVIQSTTYPYCIDQSIRIELRGYQAELDLPENVVQAIERTLLREAEDTHQRQFIANSLSSIDYTKLAKALKEGSWQEADHRTYDLIMQLIIVLTERSPSRRYETWPTSKSICLLPAEFVQEIDRLWALYSKGQFGLRCQNDIWQEVVSQTKGSTTQFYEFASRVGWLNKKKMQWISEDKFTLNPSVAPKGHLPSLGYGQRDESAWRKVWATYFKAFLNR